MHNYIGTIVVSSAVFLACLCNAAWCAIIAEAKLMPDGSSVILTAKAVTYAHADYFYVQEDLTASGIRVDKQAHGLTVGMRADVSGTIQTDANKERYIAATTAIHNGDFSVAPLGIANIGLGGSDWFYNDSTGAGQKGVSPGTGLNNIGLFIKTWGRYSQIDSTHFTISDGSGAGIDCIVPNGIPMYPSCEYAAVTGISSIQMKDTSYLPQIRVAKVDVISPYEAISTPGKPSGETSLADRHLYSYTTTGAVSSRGHSVEYSFNWGDGTTSPWTSAEGANHYWSTIGPKVVSVSARCSADQNDHSRGH